MRRHLLLACAFFVLGTPASQATMKPYYADDAKCRAVLDVAYEELHPDINPGETAQQAIDRDSKDNPLMGTFISAVYQAKQKSFDKFMNDEAMATTQAESHQLQQIEDAETARLHAIIDPAQTDKELEHVLDVLMDAADPCIERANK